MPKVALEIRISNLFVDKALDIPMYQQLYEGLRAKILDGNLRPGQRLPATRRLSEDLGISRNIVSKAFEQLTDEGYLKPAVGSGTYVNDSLPENFIQSHQPIKVSLSRAVSRDARHEFVRPNPFLLSRDTGIEPIVPFQNAVPAMDVFPYNVWASIASRSYRNMSRLQLGYDDAAGYMPLREAVASYVRMFRGVKCEADQIVIVNGTQQALSMLASGLVEQGDEVLVEDPGYGGAKVAFAHARATICPVPVGTDGIDVGYAIRHYKKAKCMYVTPAHQYPLGGTLSLAKRLELLEWARRLGTWVIEDDYDSELRYTGKPLAALQGVDNADRVIYIGSFSKVIYPGLRVAYMIFPTTQMAEQFGMLKAIFDRQTPIMEQAILTEFITQGHFYRHLRRMRLVYAERQEIMVKAIAKELPELLFVSPQEAGMHLVAWLDKKMDDRAASSILAKEGIVANALSDYTIKFKRDPALILGYAAFNKFRLRHHVIKMGQILSRGKSRA